MTYSAGEADLDAKAPAVFIPAFISSSAKAVDAGRSIVARPIAICKCTMLSTSTPQKELSTHRSLPFLWNPSLYGMEEKVLNF